MNINKILALISICCFQIAFAYTDAEVEQELANEAQKQSAKLPYETATVKLVSVYAGPGRKISYL